MEHEKKCEADDQEHSSPVTRRLCDPQCLENQEQVESEDHQNTDEAPLFTENRKDEIGVPGREIFELGLRSLLEAFPGDSA